MKRTVLCVWLCLLVLSSSISGSLGAQLSAEEDSGDSDPLHVTVAERNNLAEQPDPKNEAEDYDLYEKDRLHKAVRDGRVEDVESLLDKGARIDGLGHIGLTPLQVAAKNGNVEIIKILLRRGANTERVSIISWTALHYAAAYGQVEAVKALLDAGASKKRDIDRRYPSDVVCMSSVIPCSSHTKSLLLSLLAVEEEDTEFDNAAYKRGLLYRGIILFFASVPICMWVYQCCCRDNSQRQQVGSSSHGGFFDFGGDFGGDGGGDGGGGGD